MSEFLSFAHILENRIREEVRKEFHREFERENPLSTNEKQAQKPIFPSEISIESKRIDLEPIKLNTKNCAQEYHKWRRPPPPPKPHNLTKEQSQAKHVLEALGAQLSPSFTQKDLKNAYRSLCKRYHPDKGGNSQTFRIVKQAFDTLVELFVRPS